MPEEGPSACQKWVGGLRQLRGGDRGFSRCRERVAQEQAELWGLPAPSHPRTEPRQRAGFEAALREAERAWALCWAGCSSASSRTPVSCSPREAGSELRSWDG